MDAPTPVNQSTRPHPVLPLPPPSLQDLLRYFHPTTTPTDAQPTTPHHRPPTTSEPPEPIPAAQPNAKWDCQVCQRDFFERQRKTHLASRAHRIAAETRQKRVEPAPEATVSADSEREVQAGSDLWECAVCDRSMRRSSVESHLRGKPHAKNQAKWEEQQSVRRDELARAEQQKSEEIKREQLRRRDVGRIQQEKQKNEQKQREELRRTEQIRLVEQQRIKEEQEREAAAASEQLWMAHENQKNELIKLQNAQEKQRTEWMKRLEEALASSRQMEAQLRIEKEERRQEWIRKEEEEEAAAAELVRKQEEEEAWRQQELHRAQEREEAQRIAKQAEMEAETRRRKDAKQQQQQVIDRLALEQAYLPSPGSLVGPTGWLEPGGLTTQSSDTGAGPMGASSAAAIGQWQSIIQEMHQQQVWMQQPAVV